VVDCKPSLAREIAFGKRDLYKSHYVSCGIREGRKDKYESFEYVRKKMDIA